jgi:hypothetical protein
MEEHLLYLRRIYFPELTGIGHSYGIHSEKVSDNARVAFDLIQVIRNKIAWINNPKGDFFVDFDTPYKTSKEEDLATVEATE